MKRVALAMMLGGSLSAVPGGCVTDHDALAKRPTTGGAGGQAGDASADGAAGSGGASGGSGGAGGSIDAGGDADAFVEPEGASELTLLHGVVDAKHIAFCFARSTPTGVEFVADPIPKNGLAYGTTVALSSIAGIDFATDDIEAHVVAAEPTLLASASCATLVSQPPLFPDAGDPPIRSRVLALIPKTTFSGGYSVLLAAAGCLGGAPSHSDSIDDLLCGTGYTPETPTLTPFAVLMSRVTDSNRVGLQAINASVAGDDIDVRSLPPQDSSLNPAYIAFGIPVGGIAPKPPNLVYTVASLGSPLSQAQLEVSLSANSGSSIGFFWGDAIALGGAGTLANGRTYALVLLGPRLIVGSTGAWWNAPAVTLIPTDPDT